METVAQPAAAAALTSAQTAVWLSLKCTPPGHNFNCAEAVDIRGEIDLAQLLAAMQTVADESESARLLLLDSEHGPRQILAPCFSGELPYLDFSREPDADGAAQAWMRADFNRAIDVTRGRPWLSALLRTARDRYTWYHRSHRILLDGSDGGRMASRLAAVYSALSKSDAVPPADPFPSITQRLQEESDYRASERYPRDRQYWMERLRDAPAPLSLATQRPADGAGMLRQTVCFPAAGVNALQGFAGKLNLPLPQLLTAVTAAFLYRATGVADMVIGVTVKTAGVLPLRLVLGADLSLEQLMREVGWQMRKISQHQCYPCADLHADLQRPPGQQPLFRTVINVESYPGQLHFGSHPASLRKLAAGSVEDLAITIHERGAGQDLQIDFDANPALHSAQMLAEHQRRLLTFMAAATHSPAQKIGQLTLCDATGRRHMPETWQDNGHAATESSLAARIAEQLARAGPAMTPRFEGEAPPPRQAAKSSPN